MLVQVVPQVGFLLGMIPALISVILRPEEPALPLTYLAIYFVSVRVVQMTVGQRLGRVLNVRASLAIPGVVVLSSVGIGWLLLSAPILVIFRDTVAYLRGRLSEPPMPAGVLPGQRTRATVVAQARCAAGSRALPPAGGRRPGAARAGRFVADSRTDRHSSPRAR